MPSLDTWIWPVALSPFIGSFVGVVVMRAEAPRGIALGRSGCDSCGARLGVLDLVPLFSWLALRGRCRHCAQPVGVFYPVVELAAVAAALWPAMLFTGWPVWIASALGWWLLALALIDLRVFLLPDFLTLPLIPAGLLATWALAPDNIPDSGIGAAAGFLFVVLVRYLYERLRGREGMGFGDAKLLAASGAWVSWNGLPSVVLIAALTGLVFALLKRGGAANVSLADRVPFGTFLCLGTWIVWLYGPLMVG